MNLEERIKSFTTLGEVLGNALESRSETYGEQVSVLIENQHKLNPWFTPENVRYALKAISSELTEENLVKWTSAYPELKNEKNNLKAAVVMAGNISFHSIHDV